MLPGFGFRAMRKKKKWFHKSPPRKTFASGTMRSVKKSDVLKLSCLNRIQNYIRPGLPLLEREGIGWEHSRSEASMDAPIGRQWDAGLVSASPHTMPPFCIPSRSDDSALTQCASYMLHAFFRILP